MNSTAIASDDFLGHPKGVYVCFFTEMWERFSFYGMKALLLLYLTKYHLFGDKAGLDLLGAYGGLVYCIPVFGGMLADRWLGMRRAVLFGGILLVLGHLGMAFEGHAAYRVNGEVVRDTSALAVTYLSLALIIMGVGFLKPNISTIVGKLYAKDDPRRDSGFSLFYAGINLGALFSSLVCGFLGEAYGWKYGFGAAGIGMLAGLAMFLWGQKYLQGHAEPPQPAALKQKVMGLPREWLIYLCAVLGVLPVAWLMWAAGNGAFALGGEISLALMLMLVVLGGVLVWFAWFTGSKCTPVQRQQMIALMVLIFMALVFFTMYEQSYGSWVTFTDRLLTKDIVPSLVITGGTPLPWSIISLLLAPLGFVISARLSERRPGSAAPRTFFAAIVVLMLVLLVRDCLVIPQTAGSLTYLGGLFLVLLAPAFAALWTWMDRRGWEPGKPVKSAWGLVIGALSFVPLALAAQQVGATGEMASVWWLVLAYFLLASGEMCLSPVGLSAVTQLAVPRVMSLMMGTWFLATAFSETLAALFGKLAAIEVPEGESLDMVAAAGAYAHLFWLLMWIGLGCALAAFIAAPLLKKMMHGVK
ncbi:MFS transporter [Stenotrophomonas maltophilia]|uniref:peptide MFS transporter n=1 Tax=Stenotrophomonas maltophilia group TaxID=995085 RepID=UPI0019D4AA9E|nr:oligopeptide:H+ symporter [Stenotrophomonas maltophilia]MBN7828892.1 MFS transporter [Stenotrophomonas maltophilia]MBN7834166.1 MFS transporter [Stenotrophomonas maltophilia]MBN7858173.1 MFS transporter [Stenotrophomonas maltophilia]MBN7916113.1 MFS transporter [Stenotrophomonas maltophilia]MBO2844099.1 MFS transporter [Stenotrophomonas maltophilia]